MGELRLRGVSKNFAGVAALDQVDLQVNNQEFLVLFGPAGAGKTTLLNIIAGIHAPDRGSVFLSNRSIDHLEPEQRDVAMVFENYALYPHLNVFDNIASPLYSPKYRQPKQKVEQEVLRIASMLQIDPLLDRSPAEISNGQRQRVALGRALIRDPEVLLMDEPLAHLDAKLRNQMRAELKEIQSKSLKTTTVYVTHDYREALSLGDRIAVLNQGRIEQVGTPDEIYNQPASEFVAELLGDPEMNIVDADLREESEVLYLDICGNHRHFSVPEDVRKSLMRHSLRSVRVGFRPKDIHFHQDVAGPDYLPATVYSFEPVGATATLIVKVGEQLIRLISSADKELEMDRTIFLKFDTSRAVFFNGSGTFITRSKAGGGKAVWQS